jgi:hypothetical protein
MLKSVSGKPVVCSKLHTTCKSTFLYLSFVLIHFLTGRGLCYCEFRPNVATMHSFTSRHTILVKVAALHATSHAPMDNSHIEVFNKTLGFFLPSLRRDARFLMWLTFLIQATRLNKRTIAQSLRMLMLNHRPIPASIGFTSAMVASS